MGRLETLRVKLFADGADLEGIVRMASNPLIKGFTTNPTLMRKAGVADYESFARKLLAAVPDRPVSLEVFADDFPEMIRQARVIASCAMSDGSSPLGTTVANPATNRGHWALKNAANSSTRSRCSSL